MIWFTLLITLSSNNMANFLPLRSHLSMASHNCARKWTSDMWPKELNHSPNLLSLYDLVTFLLLSLLIARIWLADLSIGVVLKMLLDRWRCIITSLLFFYHVGLAVCTNQGTWGNTLWGWFVCLWRPSACWIPRYTTSFSLSVLL